MSAKDKPISKPMNKQFQDNYDRIFNKPKPDHKPKDWVKLGLSPSTTVEEIDCTGGKK